MNKNALGTNDLTGLEMIEIRKIGRSIEDQEVALIYGTAMMARRRAGEPGLKWDEVIKSSLSEAQEWILVDEQAPLAGKG